MPLEGTCTPSGLQLSTLVYVIRDGPWWNLKHVPRQQHMQTCKNIFYECTYLQTDSTQWCQLQNASMERCVFAWTLFDTSIYTAVWNLKLCFHKCQYTPSTSTATTTGEQTQNYVIYLLMSCEIWGSQRVNMKNVVSWYTTPCSCCVLVRTWVIRWLDREMNEQASIMYRSRYVLYHNIHVDGRGA